MLGSVFGIVGILLIAFLFSENRRSINIKTVVGAFVIQAAFAALVLYVPYGKILLSIFSEGIVTAIAAGRAGIEFIFGDIAKGSVGFVFAVMVLPTVIFFASLVSVLYYLKIMPLFINSVGKAMHKLLGTSKAESFSAAANIFVGQTEAPLVVRPFLGKMSKSEIFAVMVGGLASIAGGVMAGYIALGVEADYLIAAAFMSAPGGLLMAKMIIPETERVEVDVDPVFNIGDNRPSNVIDAAALGATDGLKLSLNIGAMLIAFIGLIALLNFIIGGIGGLFGYELFSIQELLGIIFYPIALLIGVPSGEALQVARLLGEKTIFNEFVAFISLINIQDTISSHSKAIAIFALCGFANVGSLGILLGGLGVMVPSKREIIAKLAVKAIIAATLSNLMSAALAGLFLGFL